MNWHITPTNVRRPADWMVRADDRILEFMNIGDERYLFNPAMIYKNIGISSDWTYKRLKLLVASGLVERRNQEYIITDLGEAYLQGRVKGDEIPDPVENG